MSEDSVETSAPEIDLGRKRMEDRIKGNEQRVSRLEKQASVLTGIQYLPGFEGRAASVPIIENLQGHPVNLAFSWGKDAPNMSSKYVDTANGETPEGNKQHVDTFLAEHGFSDFSHAIVIIGKFEGVQQQIEKVGSNYINVDPEAKKGEEKEVKANYVITQDDETVLLIRPADCPVVIIYAKDRDGKPLIVVDHCGREAINAGMPRQGAGHLKDKYGVDLSQATAAILPGMARKIYFITDDIHRWGNSIVERNWGEQHIDAKVDDPSRDEELGIERNEDGIQKRHVNMTGATIMQLIEAGFDPKNIQAYDVDSFEAAMNGESFSHRLINDYGGKRQGRFLVAVQLKKAA
jgi:copper oxidase (laccase) domain-containing protein